MVGDRRHKENGGRCVRREKKTNWTKNPEHQDDWVSSLWTSLVSGGRDPWFTGPVRRRSRGECGGEVWRADVPSAVRSEKKTNWIENPEDQDDTVSSLWAFSVSGGRDVRPPGHVRRRRLEGGENEPD